MARNIKQQKGAILVMSIFLIIVFISLAALFVDGFRLYETKQEIDSYSEYVVESLNKKLTEIYDCKNTCETNRNTCENKCEDSYNYNTFLTTIISDKSLKKVNPNLGAIIKINEDPEEYDCEQDISKTQNLHGIKCTLKFYIDKSDFIFAGIFGSATKEGIIQVKLCQKSCYNSELQKNYIYPYYFEDCKSKCY